MYTLMILLPMIVVTFFGFQTYSTNMKEKASDFSLELLNQLGKNVDHYLHELDRISLMFSMDSGVEEALHTDTKSPSEQYKDKMMIDKALMDIVLIPFRDVQGSYLIKPDGSIFSRYGSGQQVDYSYFRNESWYDETLQAEGRGILLPTHRVRSIEGREELSFSYLRSLIDLNKNQSAGIFRMDMNLNGLSDIFASVSGSTDQELLIVDAQGYIIYDRDRSKITEKFPIAMHEDSGSMIKHIDGEEVLVSYVTAAQSNWKIANVIAVSELTRNVDIIRNLLWTLTGVALLLSIGLSVFLTRRLLLPLKKMKTLMHKVESGDYTVQFKAHSNDEIGKLAGSFNHMVKQINELVHHIFVIRILKREADFKLLQSKINPHFLYNTLESISMKAEVDNNYEVADMIARLGRLFRMTINHDRELIILAKEMEYVEHYVKLQKIRFPDLSFIVEPAPEAMTAYILPWTIQPLVENAIIHGLAPLNHEGCIHIGTVVLNGDIIIRITDNGIGLHEEQRRDIQAQLLTDTDKAEDEIHIGLKNIFDRIRYYFGEGYGLTLTGEPGKGTTVEIRMKYLKEEGEPRAEYDSR
ncbi:cache domain-containing sensor histidine kinase [Paenibacillus daejeonensis]|uniref:cache domain-containing sensor histidine kinase n=1 Tax=Paenibacillus daejeonensis TaxID=135193 RepID=UPI00036A406D|nr:sensor histidine kinase [Paenibacillus daejeonensis]